MIAPVPTPFVYNAVCTDVHDGDTITVDIDLGFDITLRGVRLRLNGINAPELNDPSGAGKTSALKLSGILKGRPVRMVENGFAKPWDGKGQRPV